LTKKGAPSPIFANSGEKRQAGLMIWRSALLLLLPFSEGRPIVLATLTRNIGLEKWCEINNNKKR
jgi:hypothetical protein